MPEIRWRWFCWCCCRYRHRCCRRCFCCCCCCRCRLMVVVQGAEDGCCESRTGWVAWQRTSTLKPPTSGTLSTPCPFITIDTSPRFVDARGFLNFHYRDPDFLSTETPSERRRSFFSLTLSLPSYLLISLFLSKV